MSKILGSIFGFGDKMKRRLRDAASNPRDYLEMTADENQNEWKKNPEERAMGFFNPVPLGKVDPFMLRSQMKEAIEEITNMSRRSFMKKSAGLAAGSTVGAGVTAKLLRKFAPEERTLAKEANVAKQAAVEAAPKYKYNSLKEYLDDVKSYADEGHADMFHSNYDPHSAAFKANPEAAMDQAWIDANHGRDSLIKERLLQDELAYKTAKDNLARPNPRKDFKTGMPPQSQVDLLDSFSPQAKKEMKLLKDKSVSLDRTYGGTDPEHEVWTSWLANSKGDIDSTLKALQELP